MSRRRAVTKALLFVAFIVVAIYVIRFTPIREFLTQEALSRFLEEAGFLAPLIFMPVYAAGICLFVPGTLLIRMLFSAVHCPSDYGFIEDALEK